MYRILLTLAIAGALSACGDSGGGDDDSPLSSGDTSGVGTGVQPLVPEPDPDPDPEPIPSPDKYGSNVGVEAQAPMNGIEFDPATGELVLNNMTFDDKNPFERDATASARLQAAGSTYDVYQNAVKVDEYYAVFRRSDYAEAAAVGSRSTVFNRPTDLGGVGVERIAGTGALPVANATYVFNGEYAGVRTLNPDQRYTQEEIQYVTGTTQITVDIEDYDETGSVRGLIVDRKIFDSMGVELTATNNNGDTVGDATFIRLDPNTIDFQNWSIDSGAAQLVRRNGPDAGTSAGETGGTWSGLFAGPNGEEIAGIVVVQGETPIGIDPATGEYIEVDVRELGTFMGER